MRFLVLALVLSAVLLPLGEAAAGKSGLTNGLVSFGTCCGDGTTGIYTIRPDGTAQRLIFEPKFDDASLVSAWSPQGTRIAYVAPGGLWTMSAAGTQRKRLARGRATLSRRTGLRTASRSRSSTWPRSTGRNYAVYVIGSNGQGAEEDRRRRPVPEQPCVVAFREADHVRACERALDGEAERPRAEADRDGDVPVLVTGRQERRLRPQRRLWTMNANGAGAHLVTDVPSSTAGHRVVSGRPLDRLRDRRPG